MTCPECGGAVERHTPEQGAYVLIPTVRKDNSVYHAIKWVPWYGCTACEWCSEEPPPDVEPDERERDEDDGRTYGDPRDEREERRRR